MISGVHRETANLRDLVSPWPPESQHAAVTRDVVVAAREYHRTGGAAHHELMDAVQRLEQSYQAALDRPVSCFCGTGREHERGAGYHCRKTGVADDDE